MELEAFQFVDAIDARSLTMESVVRDGHYSHSESLKWHKKGLTLTEIACSLSHRRCYELIVNSGAPRALIIEDDALFRCGRIRRLRLEDIPDWAEIVFFNAFLESNPPADRLGSIVYRDTSYSGSAAAYMVTLEAAKKLLSEALPVVHAADGLLGRVLENHDTKPHQFRQQGSKIQMRAVIIHPELVTNGSTEHYSISTIR